MSPASPLGIPYPPEPERFVREGSNALVAAATLRNTDQVRARCGLLLERARSGQSAWFTVHEDAVEGAAALIIEALRPRQRRGRLPDLSWWRRLEAGGIDRRTWLAPRLAALHPGERAHALVDLTVIGVLLAGFAGPAWRYHEAHSGRAFGGCEGVAVASFHAFSSGLFSSRADRPLQADATGLRAVQPEHLALAFQSTASHPLAELHTRTLHLRRLGELLAESPEVFGQPARAGALFDLFATPYGFAIPPTADVKAHDILSQILISLPGLWPQGHEIGGQLLGDCWRHQAVLADDASTGWVPFHQWAQYLTYSLIEPFQEAGVAVRQADRLTGLPGRHTASLLLDTGVLRLRDPALAERAWAPGDEAIVEWRALTIALLDQIAPRVRELLRMDPVHAPLGGILEAGTRPAGHTLAQRLRGGRPALRVEGEILGF